MTPYAAGCALCGADLIAARRELERRRQARPSLPTLDRPSWLPEGFGFDAFIGGVLLALVLLSPVLGAVIAGLAAYKADRDGERVRRNFCLAAVLTALILMVVLEVAPGSYFRLVFWVWG